MVRQEVINYTDSVFALRCMEEMVNGAYSDDDMLVYVKNGLLRIRVAEK